MLVFGLVLLLVMVAIWLQEIKDNTLGPNELAPLTIIDRKYDEIDLSFITQAGNDVIIGYNETSTLETPIGPFAGPSIDYYLNPNYTSGGQFGLTENTKYYYGSWVKGPNDYQEYLPQYNECFTKPKYPIFSSIESTYNSITFKLNHNNINGVNKMLVIWNTNSSYSFDPVDGIDYSNNNTINKIIINLSTDNTHIHTGLLQSTIYYYSAYTYSTIISNNLYDYSRITTFSRKTKFGTPPTPTLNTNYTNKIKINIPNNHTILFAWKTSYSAFAIPIEDNNYQINEYLDSNNVNKGQVLITHNSNGGLSTYIKSNLTPNTTYHFKVWYEDADNPSSAFSPIIYSNGSGVLSVTTFKLALEPHRLTLYKNSDITIELLLSDNLSSGDKTVLLYNTVDVFGVPTYDLSVGDDVVGGGKVLVNTDIETYIHNNLNSNTTYYYKEYGLSSQGIFSQTTKNLNVTTRISPTVLSLVNKTADSIILNINNNLSTDKVFLIYSLDGVFGIPNTNYSVGDVVSGGGIVLVNSNILEYTHIELYSDTIYYYRVWVNYGSQYSNIYLDLVVNTDDIIPNEPTLLSLIKKTDNIVKLNIKNE